MNDPAQDNPFSVNDASVAGFGSAPPAALITPLSSESQAARFNAFKGLFIVLVVMGHNPLIGQTLGVNGVIYLFHVAMFLYLPFLRPREKWDKTSAIDIIVRYGWPLLIFLILFVIYFTVTSGKSLSGVPVAVVWGLFASSARVFDQVAGAQLLWFLPALIGLRLAMKGFAHLRGGWLLTGISLALVSHVTVGLLPYSWQTSTPLGWPVVAFIFFPGLVIHALWRPQRRMPWPVIVIAILGLIPLVWYYLATGLAFNIGYLAIPSPTQPLRILSIDLIHLIVFFCAMEGCRLVWAQRLLGRLGRLSFEIYLLHQPVSIILRAVVARLRNGEPITVSYALLTLATTLAVTLPLAMLIHALPPLRQGIFPVGLDALRRWPRSLGRMWGSGKT